MYFLTPAVRVLTGLHLAGFVLSQGFNLTTTLGLWDTGHAQFKPYQWATHIFLHNGLWDVGVHTLIMIGTGTVLERILGTWRFTFLYLAIAVSTTCLYSLFMHQAVVDTTTLYDAFMASACPENFIKYVNRFPQSIYQMCHAFYDTFLLDPDHSEHLLKSKSMVSYLQATVVNKPRVGCSGLLWGILTAFSTCMPRARVAFLMLFPMPAVYFTGVYVSYLLYQVWQSSPMNQPEHLSQLMGVLIAFLFIKYTQRARSS